MIGSLNDLAMFYYDQDDYAKTEQLYKRALAISENALGPSHPFVAIILDNLAALYQDTKRDDEAEPLEQRAAKIRAINK